MMFSFVSYGDGLVQIILYVLITGFLCFCDPLGRRDYFWFRFVLSLAASFWSSV